MGSLFTRIFLAFWLAAVLLGVALFSAERLWGDRDLEQTERWLRAHAETAAALLAEEEPRALRRWLMAIGREEGALPVLMHGDGRPVFQHPFPPPLKHWLERLGPLEPGTFPVGRGHSLVVAAVPGTELFLVAGHGHVHSLPIAVRILLGLAVVALVSLGLAALLTRPIRRLRGAAQALAEGDLSVRVGYGGRDEVAALARDFDTMAGRLRELLEAQKRLLRDVSHELRSPLARLRVALELAEKEPDPRRTLERIGKEADQLERLVGDVLSLSRLESGQAALERRPVDLAALVQAVVHDADFEARARDRSVQFTVEGAVPPLTGDPVLLRSAVENVVRNAVRHTAPGTAVEVGLHSEAGQLAIQVRDHGPGVPEAELGRMFEPFTRVGEARDRHSGGYGLGLAISGRAVTAHGGTVQATNHPQGGLSVRLAFPITRTDNHE